MELSALVFLSLAYFTEYNVTVTHVVACVRIPCLLKAEYYSTVWMQHVLFVHLSGDGHLGCFYLLATVNSVALNTGVQIFNINIRTFKRFGSFQRLLDEGLPHWPGRKAGCQDARRPPWGA